ncbi:MAG TPA: hypothetical protein DCP63_09885 [Bacteroidetes bacterium]|nr:hypothetical protein [Bacteroidota bacterium]
MKTLRFAAMCLMLIGQQLAGRQITGRTNQGSFGPPPETIKDNLPPEIELTEPAQATTRGLKIVGSKADVQTTSSSVMIRGVATDPGGVKLVLIDGQEATLRSTGPRSEFSRAVNLETGANLIDVKALDHAGNENVLTLTIVREEALFSGNYYALVVAIQDYQDQSINDLEYPIQDAEQLVTTLTSMYRFNAPNVIFLKNPSRTEIILTFDQLARRLTGDDNLLIFYAGHGYWDERLKQGFWLPVNASQSSRTEWISNGTIRDYIGGVSTKHTLLVSDACFSGGIFRTRDAFVNPPTAIRELYKLPSRKAMTSGTMKEQVPDKSVFVEYLIKRLKENAEPMLTAENLFASFRQAVINNSPIKQIPQFGEIRETGDEGGDFIFVRR